MNMSKNLKRTISQLQASVALNLLYSIGAMIVVVVSSNVLVQFPINDWLTYGALTYPVSYLITELTNRFYGPRKARIVVYAGFVMAVCVSTLLAPFKIAFTSASAFLLSQLLDIYAFSAIRRGKWWFAPLLASCLASVADSAVFWTLAFWGEDVPLLTLAIGDTLVKIAVDLLMLLPFRMVVYKHSLNLSPDSN